MINEMAKGRAETWRLPRSNAQREVTGWVGQRQTSELVRFDIFIIELGSKKDEEMKLFGGTIVTKDHLLSEMLSQALSSTPAAHHFPFPEENGTSEEPPAASSLHSWIPAPCSQCEKSQAHTWCAGVQAGRSRVIWRLVPDSCSPEAHLHLRS